MKLRRRSKQHTEVHTGALNDILFILLLFFLIVSTLANPNVIKLAQPKANGDTKSKQTVIVSIDAKLQMYVGQKLVATEADLLGLLQHFLSNNNNPVVVINADKSVPIDKVVAVMNLAKKLGAKSVLSVKKP